MKLNKILAASLLTTMIALPTSSVFADTVKFNEDTNWTSDSVTQEIPVYATTTLGSDKYAADIEWGTMEFTYSGSNWDVENHEYGTTAEWTITGDNNQILVRNHSNKPINVSAVATKAADVTGIEDIAISVSEFTTPTIEASPITHSSSNDNIPTSTATVSVTGQPGKTMTRTQIGSITVTLTKAD